MKSRSVTVRTTPCLPAFSPSRRPVCGRPGYDQVTLWARNLSRRSVMGLYSLKVSARDSPVHPSCHWEEKAQSALVSLPPTEQRWDLPLCLTKFLPCSTRPEIVQLPISFLTLSAAPHLQTPFQHWPPCSSSSTPDILPSQVFAPAMSSL